MNPVLETQTALTEDQASAIAVDADVYLYPLVLMDFTRRQSIHIEAVDDLHGGCRDDQ